MRLGLFDSGIGGLTVLQAIRSAFPTLDVVYLGDTARVPYGIKSARSIERYAQQAVRCLVDTADVSAVVVACNTASALATGPLRQQFDDLPIISVIEPGAAQAVQAVSAVEGLGHVGVLATESTVRGGAYERAIHAIDPRIKVTSQACQLLVALAEEGWVDGGGRKTIGREVFAVTLCKGRFLACRHRIRVHAFSVTEADHSRGGAI